MRSKYYNAERKATTELGDVPNPPFLTNSRVGVSTITTTKAQANVFLSPKESLPERLQFQKRSQCCWRWNDSQLGSKCVNILERELQLKLHIHDRIIQISILSEKAPHLKKIKIGDGCDKQWVCQHEKTEENFLQSLQLLHQISPFSKDKTFLLSKFPPILFATNTLLILLASMVLEYSHNSPIWRLQNCIKTDVSLCRKERETQWVKTEDQLNENSIVVKGLDPGQVWTFFFIGQVWTF